MWLSSGQCDMRGLLGASAKGFLAPIKRHEEKTAPFSPLDVVCGCLLWAVTAVLSPWGGDTEDDGRKEKPESLMPSLGYWISPGTVLHLTVLLGAMINAFIIGTLLCGLPVASNHAQSNWCKVWWLQIMSGGSNRCHNWLVSGVW